jgi:hypothetical protein
MACCAPHVVAPAGSVMTSTDPSCVEPVLMHPIVSCVPSAAVNVLGAVIVGGTAGSESSLATWPRVVPWHNVSAALYLLYVTVANATDWVSPDDTAPLEQRIVRCATRAPDLEYTGRHSGVPPAALGTTSVVMLIPV